jgi:hypothetical protein
MAKRGERTSTAARKGRKQRAQHEVRYSRLDPPAGLAPEAWQAALRRQFGREQNFVLENVGDEPVFSEFRITNPQSGGRYRVAIRGIAPGDNYCSCPDRCAVPRPRSSRRAPGVA